MEDKNKYLCVNCGGGFPRNQMCMDTEYDSDFCDDCYPEESEVTNE